MNFSTFTNGIPASRRETVRTLLVALFAGIAGVSGSYAYAGDTPSFIVAPIAGFLARAMLAPVVSFAITTLGSFGELLNLGTAIFLAVALLAGTSLIALVVGQRFESAVTAIGLTASLGWLATASVTEATLPAFSALSTGFASATVIAVSELLRGTSGSVDDTHSSERRRLLGGLASALGISLFGYFFGSQQATTSSERLETTPRRQQLFEEATAKSLDIPGIDPLISDTESFYEVDINNIDPAVDTEEWTLSVTGAVEQERTYSYTDITSMEADDRFYTLRCVGDSLNGTKMDNAIWTGVPIMNVVDEAKPNGSYVVLRAADDYYEEFPVEALRGGMLAYGMNGRGLPREHGAPVRALLPGHWGEPNVKWITEIEFSEEEVTGYWEQRGWHGTGPVKTVAKFHAINHLPDGRIQVGGHAYAGTRGIQSVKVSVNGDGGPWHEATLSAPLSGEAVWRQWEYTYEPPATESHEVVVRATDGTGTLQPQERAEPFPNGPSGWVSRTVNMAANEQ
ncbi:molybdopterin-dependent oxidoreductase [Haladaptatus sp. DFWS20]|uniref:molybdopterin-dependent oxidoreductase n=1 Tax=Haladaptatus sp. DFWS20 TaxID=3403467 RepID=UPI003EBB928F